jgi:hypothetical protein
MPEVSSAKWMVWTGRVMSALPVLMMGMSGTMKLIHIKPVVDNWGTFGFPLSTLTPIGLIEVACVVVYLIPRTVVMGAILMSAYLTAAFCTHLRVLDPSGAAPLLLAVFTWGGLWLRDGQIRALIPIRSRIR